MLSRCVAPISGRSRPSIGAAGPYSAASGALPRDFSDLLSPADGRRADRRARGSRAVHPNGQARRRVGPGMLHRAGRLRRRDAGSGGFGQGVGPIRRRRNDRAAGTASVVATPDRLRSAHGRRPRSPRRRPTPTSRRRTAGDSIRTTTSTTCSSCRPPGRSGGSCTSPCTRIPCRRSRGPTIARRSPSVSEATRLSTPCCQPATRCICPAAGFIRRKRWRRRRST